MPRANGNDIQPSQGRAIPSQVEATARSFIGTPYRDFGRIKGHACDCIGLVMMTAHELDLFTGDFFGYTPTPFGRTCEQVSDEKMNLLWTRPGWPEKPDWLQPGAIEAAKQGSVGLFWFSNRREPQHFGIFGTHPLTGGPTLIHAHSRMKVVTEASVNDFWCRRLVKVYDIWNVERNDG